MCKKQKAALGRGAAFVGMALRLSYSDVVIRDCSAIAAQCDSNLPTTQAVERALLTYRQARTLKRMERQRRAPQAWSLSCDADGGRTVARWRRRRAALEPTLTTNNQTPTAAYLKLPTTVEPLPK